jgi:DNA invertase Pin-like site-specific DNA recombinase
MESFGIYARISQEGDRTDAQVAEQLDLYEQRCRTWARSQGGIEIGVVELESDVSGAAAVADRRLGGLIERVESGALAGIITPNLERFGRGMIEGALAYKRIVEAGGRLVCVEDGLDSERDGNKTVLHVRLAFAEEYLDRVRSNFTARQVRAAARGVYLARAPLGYVKDKETGKLVVDIECGPLIQELFNLRAGRAQWQQLVDHAAQSGHVITVGGARGIIGNRAYLGEAVVQSGTKGQPQVSKNHHAPLISEHEWQAAQSAAGAFSPRNGKTLGVALRGLVYCSGCGRRCKVLLNGSPGHRSPSYACTAAGCPRGVAIKASRLDPYVERVLWSAILARDPHVGAIQDDARTYQDALDVVAQAQASLAEYRDDVDLQRDLGLASWKDGLQVRKAALETARRELGRIKSDAGKSKAATPEEYEAGRAGRYIARVVLLPSSRQGASDPVEDRAQVWFIGPSSPPPCRRPVTPRRWRSWRLVCTGRRLHEGRLHHHARRERDHPQGPLEGGARLAA